MRGKTFPKRPQVAKQRLGCLERGEVCSTEAAERGSNWLVVVVTQSCLALCDPMDYSPPDSSVLEILQGRLLEGIAIFFSRSLSDPGMESLSPALQADFLLSHREAKLTGCHRFLFQFVVHPGMGTGLPYISVCVSYSVISDSLQPLGCIAYQAPLSIEFSRQEFWSGLPFPSPGYLPNPGLNPGLMHSRQMLYHLSY